jgi:hypothetical protein
METLSFDEIFNPSVPRTKSENFEIFKDVFGKDKIKYQVRNSFLVRNEWHKLNLDTFVNIIVKYKMNNNVLDLIDYVESIGYASFTYYSDETNYFHFTPDMFVKFIELKGSEEILKKIALRTVKTIDKEHLYFDILFCSILTGNISTSFILELFKMNKFLLKCKSHFLTPYREHNILDTKIGIFMYMRTHILYRKIPKQWEQLFQPLITSSSYKFLEFVNKLNPNLNEDTLDVSRPPGTRVGLDNFRIDYMCEQLMSPTSTNYIKGFTFPQSYFSDSSYVLTDEVKNIVSYCYACCLRLMCEYKNSTVQMPIYITSTLKNIYQINPKCAKKIMETLIMNFLENDIAYDKNFLLYSVYEVYEDAIDVGQIILKLFEKKLYSQCHAVYKYLRFFLKSSIYTEILIKEVLKIYVKSETKDDEKIELKSLCETIISSGFKNDDSIEKMLNDIGIESGKIKWSWRWTISDSFNPNLINDKGETLFEEAYVRNKRYCLKYIIPHKKFRPMKSPKNIIDIVINDKSDTDWKKEILGKLLQTSIILKSEQVKKITELGIDVYKTLQKRICFSDDRIENLEDSLDKLTKTFKLNEERNDIIQQRLKLMEIREYKIMSFLQMMCAQYAGDAGDEVMAMLTDIE